MPPSPDAVQRQIDELSNMERLDLSEEQSRRMGSSTWDVFDADGRFLGPIDLPARFTPMVWQPDAVYGRWLDDQDVAYVRKLDLARGARSPGEACR